MTVNACMGGFCPIRERCARYLVEGVARHHREPAERLCAPSEHNAFKPMFEVIPIEAVEPTTATA